MVWKYAGRYVLPFSPSDMKMGVRWNTSLTDTMSGTWTRSLSHEHPIFTVNYVSLLKGAGLQFIVDSIVRDIGQEVLIPLWQDVASNKVSSTEVAVDTRMTFYKVGSLVLLWSSDIDWQIVDVTAVNPSSVEFGVNGVNWKCVVPIEEGFVSSAPMVSTDKNRNSKLTYSVMIKRLEGPLSEKQGDAYPEMPILNRAPIQSKKDSTYTLHINTVKSVGGVIKVNSVRSVPTVGTTHTWDNQSRDEYLAMLDFLAQCRGRKNAFAVSSFTCDLALLSNGAVGTNFIDVYDPGLQTLNLIGQAFTVVRGAQWSDAEIYEVVAIASVAGGVRLSFASNIIETIFTTDTVSILRLCRLASDSIVIDIKGFNRSSASIAVRDTTEGGF